MVWRLSGNFRHTSSCKSGW